MTLAAAMLSPGAALAGSYTASDEASLKAAITAANADVDPSATITLSADFTVSDPAALPTATKLIILNTGGHTLGGAAFNGFQLNIAGGGEVQFTGTGVLGSDLSVISPSALRIRNGGKLTAGIAKVNGALSVSGPGSELTATLFQTGDTAGVNATIRIDNGGVVHLTGSSSIGRNTNTNNDIIVTGLGSRLDAAGGAMTLSNSGTSRASLTIADQATVTLSRLILGAPSSTVGATVVITDPGSSLTVVGVGNISVTRGTVDVLNGAQVTAGALLLGGNNNATSQFRVAGGSSVAVAGDVQLGLPGGVATNTTSRLILSDGGAMTVGGALTVGGAATRAGELIIGGNGAAQAAGVLNASNLVLTAGTGALTFNHTDTDYVFGAAIAGAGTIRQTSGVTHLTGNSSTFTGTTTVSGGELRVDGTLGGATSAIAVDGGGVLGGSGTIGGNVAVADGALAPGNSAGTLTIAGNLTLAPASSLEVEFGLPNVVGGPLNDLIKVGGDLTLDGTIDVAVTAGGVFGAGLYRVINYGGVLTDNGLTVGATPPGSTVTVQTAIAGQVNLINTAGLAVNFWDGDAGGNSGNSHVDGGNGTWTGADLNWTTQTGAVNSTYTAGDFLVFAAAPGLVNVGAVNAGGLQFAVDGYHLTGGTITLNGGDHTVRVGDGTADGKDYVAIIDTPIVGAGAALTKTDLGTLILNGANTYSGVTNGQAGTLLVNGSIAGGGNATVVGVNGTLGGTGTIRGGAVSGTLAPGDLTSPGTLTTNFDLTLNSTAVLRYRLGQADTVGGALNDLLVVKGNLTLDGTLNVTQSAGGTFGPGIYRLIDYTGTLTDHGLDLGSLPGGFTNTIQTSIAGQVNLVANTPPPGGGGGGPPPVFDFWDGDAGLNGDGVVTGGDGIWRATPANWTTADGSANGAYADGLFAIFAGAPGKVTVDGSAGAIGVGGLQFAADGYSLAGDPVTLEAAQTIVRVGDGTTAGAGFTATVASSLIGPGQLDKTDAGTLILTGANTYAGGTHVSGGTLQLGAGGTTGSILGDVVNDGVLAFDRADGATFTGVISGGGTIAQIGGGTLTLTADSSAFAGRTEVRAGALAVDGVLGGDVAVLSGARLVGTGRVGSLTNAQGGTVSPGHGDVGVLTVAGAYAGAGGVLEMDVQLGGPTPAADRLVVRGATAGSTLVQVNRLGGGGAPPADGILLVQVDGASDGVFTLANGDYRLGGETVLVDGAYGYVLRKDAADGDWRLRSNLAGDGASGPLYQPGAPIYEAYPQALQLLNGLPTLRQRTGGRQWTGAAESGVWGRISGGHTRLRPVVSSSQTDLKADRWSLQFGLDQTLADDLAGGRLVGELTARYGEVSADVASPSGGGDIETKGYGLGFNLTWTDAAGAYVDAQAQASWFDSDLSSDLLGRRADGADGDGQALSLEAGRAVAFGQAWSLTPQAQLSYSRVDFQSVLDPFGAVVSSDESDSLVARLGLALDHAWTSGGGVYALVNLRHEFLDGARVDVSGAPLVSRAERTWGGLAAGGTYSWGAGRYTVYGEASADTSLSGFGDSYDVTGTAGFRLRF